MCRLWRKGRRPRGWCRRFFLGSWGKEGVQFALAFVSEG